MTDLVSLKIWEYIDEEVKNLSKEDYLEVLEEIIDNAKIRAEAVREEMENE